MSEEKNKEEEKKEAAEEQQEAPIKEEDPKSSKEPEKPSAKSAEETPPEKIQEEKKDEGAAKEKTAEEIPAEEAADEIDDEELEKRKGEIIGAEKIKSGMTVRVHERIKDISPKGEERERVQVFQGIVIGVKGSGKSRTMTVRRVSKGFGVEKIYPLNSPNIAKIEVVKFAKVRKAKLSFLKNKKRRFKRKLKDTWIEQD